MLKALLDVRASLLDPKKLPASALGQFFEDQCCGSGFHFNPVPDPSFQVNPDPDPIRIQGFNDQKI